jgi:hypothetical protein
MAAAAIMFAGRRDWTVAPETMVYPAKWDHR